MLSLSDRYSDVFGIANASQIIAVTAPAPENSLSLRGQNYLFGSPPIHSVQFRNATGRATAWMDGQR